LDGSEPEAVEIIYICDTEDDLSLDMRSTTVLTCEDISLKLPPEFKPHPLYESCTPSVQTIALREAAHEEIETAPFVPYADSDDPNWNIKKYLDQFASFAWERLGDPDGNQLHLSFELNHGGSLIAMTVEVIQFEVLRRLHFGHGLSLEDIDVTGVLPESRQANRDGLIYRMTQRCVGSRLC
jgi:hypothetical protein